MKGGDKQVYSDGSERDCAQQTFEGFPPPEEGEGYSYSAGFGYLGGPQEGKGRGKSELQIQEIHRQANILGFAILLSIFLSNASFFLLTRLFALLSSGVVIMKNGQVLTNQFLHYFIRLLVYLAQIVIPYWVVSCLNGFRLKKDLPRGPVKGRTLVPCTFILLAIGIVGIASANVLGGLASQLNIRFVSSAEPAITSAPAYLLYFLSLSAVPAVVEEVVFRGVVLQPLRRFGDRFAVVVSAIVFAMAHQSFVKAPNMFFVGLFLGYVAIKSGSILTTVVLHFVNNALSLVLATLQTAVSASTYALVQNSLFALLLLLGVFSVAYLSRQDSAIFAIEDYEDTNTLTTKMVAFIGSGGFVISLCMVAFLMASQARIL
ncbi:lysostaphin resistance A-like protein [Bittarella sp. HCP28S3_D9]|uniref:CPBP family intramembrane glutamic endopeptidase n=1 Tax=Bittarella sp. HCP28S3_D9 TaxID=3440253 RepID=UPI003F88B873